MRMKKIILSVFACLLALPMMAQLGEERRNLVVGVNLGMNMTILPPYTKAQAQGMIRCFLHCGKEDISPAQSGR